MQGDKAGVVRFTTREQCTSQLEKAKEEPFKILGKEVHLRRLEGEEEQSFYKRVSSAHIYNSHRTIKRDI